MKKFEFRLAAVLRLREAQLTLEKNRLQQLFAERAKLQKNLASIQDERKESTAWIQELSNIGSSDLKSLSAFLLGSKSRETTLGQAIEGCDADIEDQRKRTLLAERNQKLLLNLRARRREEWQKDFDRELEIVAQEAWQSASRSKQPLRN